jgi:transposase
VQDQFVANDTSEQAVGVEPGHTTRQRRSVPEKRQMVEATLVAGTSIARVARAYGVNANQLFHWRKLYKQGLLEDPRSAAPRLLPVRVADIDDRELTANAEPQTANARAQPQRGTPTIRIEIAGKVRMSIDGADERYLRTVLELLLS